VLYGSRDLPHVTCCSTSRDLLGGRWRWKPPSSLYEGLQGLVGSRTRRRAPAAGPLLLHSLQHLQGLYSYTACSTCRASTPTQPAARAGPLLACSLQHLLGRVVEDAVHLLGREVELQRRLHAAHAPVLPLSESLPPSCPCPSHWRVAALSHGASHLVADGEKKKLSPGGMAPHTWRRHGASHSVAAWRLTRPPSLRRVPA
jgi:hypothetical protein